MLRRVAFEKAIVAGVTGACAWEAFARVLITTGVPAFDIVAVLGTMFVGEGAVWWPIGLIMHASVGAIWAIFYAYFFWSHFDWPPVAQGTAFSLIPAVLAGLVMVPQLGWMHPAVAAGTLQHPGAFAVTLGWPGPFVIFGGHLIYGAVLGAIYRRPVGFRADRAPLVYSRSSPSRQGGVSRMAQPSDGPANSRFMFATGIECSYPTIENGRWRIDEMEETGHYRYWRRDLELVRDMGLRYLRYGPPLHKVWVGPGTYDWDFVDDVFDAMRELGISPIVDLCHFGVPKWIENFQNPDFPAAFAEYAAALAARYREARLFTPVNEMFVTARMSALDGVWNEQMKSERGFTTAVKNLAKASALGAEAIVREQPRAAFVNSESGEFFQACCPDADIVRTADFENERRFVALDLLYGVPVSDSMRTYLFEHGLTEREYEWFMRAGPRIASRSILGIDYYEWNEKLIDSDRRPRALGELFGWYVITRQYYNRYRRPLMHTETNCQDAAQAPDWLWRQWHNVHLMRRSGIPVVGFTWYSLIDQVDWDIGLSRPLGNVNPVGLYDLNRDPRPVAESYQRLVRMFADEHIDIGSDAGDLNAILKRTDAGSRPRAS